MPPGASRARGRREDADESGQGGYSSAYGRRDHGDDGYADYGAPARPSRPRYPDDDYAGHGRGPSGRSAPRRAGNDSRDDGYGPPPSSPSSSARRSPQRDAYDTYGNARDSYDATGYGQPQQNWQGGYGRGGWDDAAGTYGANNSDQWWAASPWRDDPPRGRRAAAPAPAAPPERRSRKRVWVVLLIIALLLGLGGGGVFIGFRIYSAPAAGLNVFCGDLKAKSYPAAYALLTASFQSQLTQAQFVQAMTNLGAAEGPVVNCGQSAGGNSYSYRLLSSAATINLTITRGIAGPLQGIAHLRNEGGAWKVDALDDAVFGVTLDALTVFGAYCSAIQAQRYDDAYALLTQDSQKQLTKVAFSDLEQLHDGVDGNVTDCHLAAIGSRNTSVAVAFTASITRASLAARKGSFKLALESGAWKISQIDAPLFGNDLGPLLVTARFCADLTHRNYADVYGLFSPNFLAGATQAQVVAVLNGTAYPYVQWTGCGTPDLKMYKVGTSTAIVVVPISLLPSGASQAVSEAEKVSFVIAGNAWKIDNIQKQ
jgi:hypothetical protein